MWDLYIYYIRLSEVGTQDEKLVSALHAYDWCKGIITYRLAAIKSRINSNKILLCVNDGSIICVDEEAVS